MAEHAAAVAYASRAIGQSDSELDSFTTSFRTTTSRCKDQNAIPSSKRNLPIDNWDGYMYKCVKYLDAYNRGDRLTLQDTAVFRATRYGLSPRASFPSCPMLSPRPGDKGVLSMADGDTL
ncbi:hypothetical protein EIP86_007993 [Pleurotus ostreatoroseus]|nr:hypothetical protein EIP86_007993 [Pleurotus ostreatoroseus]